ncbi:MAG: hypothetical protein J0H29_24425 [Sphingobacteriales bacterium]|nr:hypothetical protein [Sphingobacteriales bacterium]OJY89692.1 MAG: hypothetical protein BGP14_22545 [Sphingobacteriales bacterium 44-15]
MTKQPFPFLYIITIFLFSCSSIKLKNGVTNFKPDTAIENVKIIGVNESISHNGQVIGDFVLREDWKNDWESMKKKMIEFARKKGANLITIKTIGWGKKGNGFYADGSLYYVEQFNQVSESNNNCSVFIARNSLESPMGSAFTINVKINETTYNNLSKKDVIEKKFHDCNETVTISLNGKNHEIKLNGRSRYYQVSKQTSGNSIGGGIAIGIGGISITEIEDEELARLIMYQNR